MGYAECSTHFRASRYRESVQGCGEKIETQHAASLPPLPLMLVRHRGTGRSIESSRLIGVPCGRRSMRRLYEWPKLRGLPGHRLAPPGLATLNCMVHLIHSFFITSADPSAVTVTSAGLVCAGVFDSNSIVCQTKDSSGNLLPDKTVNVTVTSGGLTATVPVYVHSHVDNITVSGPSNPPVCVSQNQTELFTAKVFSNQQGKPVDITANVGPLTWSTGTGAVATVDQNGVITSRQPGATTVVASVANTTGTPAVVVACSPRTISLHLAGVTDTTFSAATGTAQTSA